MSWSGVLPDSKDRRPSKRSGNQYILVLSDSNHHTPRPSSRILKADQFRKLQGNCAVVEGNRCQRAKHNPAIVRARLRTMIEWLMQGYDLRQ